MSPTLPPVHDDLTFLSPLSSQRADQLVRWVTAGLGEADTLLDAGCGWGELALRAAQVAPHAQVVGIDLDEERVLEATRRAEVLGVGHRVHFLAGDAANTGPSPAAAIVVIGASQVWTEQTEEPAPLDYAAALHAIRARVDRGGRVVYGEGVWSRAPTPEAVAPLGGRLDEFLSLPELAALCADHGFAVVGVGEATQAEWDDFESGYLARYAHWLAGHSADHPDAAEVREAAARHRAGYLAGYRGTLGLAYLQLLAV